MFENFKGIVAESPTESLGSVKDRIAKFESLKEGELSPEEGRATVDIVVTPVTPAPPEDETEEALSPLVEDVSQAEVKSLDSYGSEKGTDEEEEGETKRRRIRHIETSSTTTTYTMSKSESDAKRAARGQGHEFEEAFDTVGEIEDQEDALKVSETVEPSRVAHHVRQETTQQQSRVVEAAAAAAVASATVAGTLIYNREEGQEEHNQYQDDEKEHEGSSSQPSKLSHIGETPVPSEVKQLKSEETTHIEPSFETTAEVPTPAHEGPEEEYHHVFKSEEYEHHAEKDVASPVPSEGEQFKTEETTHIETVGPSFETTTKVITSAHEEPEEEYHHVIDSEEYEHHAEKDVASPVPSEGEQFKTEETTHIETVGPSFETTAEVSTPAHKEPEEEYHHVIESEEYEHHAEKDVASPVPSEGEQFKTEETTQIETVEPSFETTAEVPTSAHEEHEEEYHHVIDSEEYEHHAEKDVASPVPSEGEQFKTEETTHIETVEPSFETTAEVPTPAHEEPEEEYHHVIDSEEYEHHAEKDVASPVPSEGEQFKTEETTHIETVGPSFETTAEVSTPAHEEPEEEYHHVIDSEEYEHHAEKDVASPVPSEGEQFKTEETTHIETVEPSFETTAEVPTPAHEEPEEEYHHVIDSEEYEHHAEKDVASPVPSEGEQFKTEETTHIETVGPSFETTAEVSTPAHEEPEEEYHHVIDSEEYEHHAEKDVASPVPSEGEQFKTEETTHIETVEPSFETTAEVPTSAHEEHEEEYHHVIKSEEYEHHAEKDVASPVPSEGEQFKTEETTHIETVEPSFETTAEVPTPAHEEPEEEYHHVIDSEEYEHHAEKDVASPVPSEGEQFKTEETTHIETVGPSFETTAEVSTPAHEEPEEEYHHVIDSEEYEHHAEKDVALPVPSEGEQKTEETTHIETVEPSFETTAEVPTSAHEEHEEEYHHVIDSEEYEHHAEKDVASPVPSEGEQFKTEETTQIETVEPSFETTAEVPTSAHEEHEEEYHHVIKSEEYEHHAEKDVASPVPSEGEQFKTEETTQIETVEPSFETTAEVPTPAHEEPEEEYHHVIDSEEYEHHAEKDVASPVPSEGEQFKTEETTHIETVEPSFETTAEVPTPAHEEPEEEYHHVIDSEEYEHHAEKDVASPVPSEGEQFKTEETTQIETVEPSFETTAEVPTPAHEEPEEKYHHVIDSEEYEHHAEKDVASPVPSEGEQFKTEETTHIETVEPSFETTAEVPTPAHEEPEEEYHHVIESEEYEHHAEKDVASPVPSEGEQFKTEEITHIETVGPSFETTTEVITAAHEEPEEEYHHVIESEEYEHHAEKDVASPVPSEGEQFKTEETTHIETVGPSFETTAEVSTPAHKEPEEEYHHVIESEEYEHHAEKDVASPVPSEGEQFKTEETTQIETVEPSFETTAEVPTSAHEEHEEEYHHVIDSEEYEHHAEKDVASPVPSEGEQFKTEETTHIETVEPSFETTAEVPTPAHEEPEEEYHHVIDSEEYEHHAEKDVASPVPSEGEQFKTEETTHIETVGPSFETTAEVSTPAHEEPEEEYHHVIDSEEYEHHAEKDVASPVPSEGEQFKTEETTHIETVEPSFETTAEVPTPAHEEPEEEYHHVIDSEEYEHHAEKDVASPVPSEGEQFKTEETTHIETVGPSFETTAEVSTPAHEEPEEEYHHVIDSEEYEHHAEKDVASPVPSEGEQFKTEETTHIETVEPSFETTAEVPTSAHEEHEEEYHHVIKSEEYEHHAEKDVASPVPSEGEQFKTEETTHIETVEPSFETTAEVPTPAHEEPEEEYHHVIDSEEYEHHAEKDVASPVPSEGEQFKTEETTHIETVGPSFETTAEVSTPAHEEPEEEYHHVIDSEEYEHHAEKDVALPVPSEGEQKTEETTHIETVEPSFETTAEVPTSAHEEHEEEYHHVIDSEEYEHHAEKDVASPVPSEGEQFKTEETTQIETVEPSFETTAEVPTSAHEEHEEEYHHVIKSEEYEHHAEKDVASPVPSEGEQFKTEETTQIETVEPSFETTAEVPTPAHEEPEEEYHHVIDSEEYEHHAEKDVASPVPSEGEQFKTEETTHIETVEPSFETTAEVPTPAHEEPEEEYHHVIDSEEYEHHAEKDVASPVPSEGEQFKTEETTQIETVEPSFETTAEVPTPAHEEPEEKYHHVIDSEEYEHHAEKDVASPVPSEGEQFKTEETTHIETVEPSFETTAEVPTPAHEEPEEEYHHVIESEEYEHHAEKDVASPVPSEGEQFKTEEITHIETVEPSFETTTEVITAAHEEPEEEYHHVIESEEYEHHAEKDVASPVPSEGEQFKTEETTHIETVEPSFETTAEVPTPAHEEPEEEYHHVIESEEYEHHAEKDVASPVPSEGEQFKTEETTHIETVEPSFETTAEVPTPAHEEPEEEYHHVIESEEYEHHAEKDVASPVPSEGEQFKTEEITHIETVEPSFETTAEVPTPAHEEPEEEYHHVIESEEYEHHAEKDVASPVPSEGERFKTEETTHIETVEPSFETTAEVPTPAHKEPEEEYHHAVAPEAYKIHDEKEVTSPISSEGVQFKTEETTHIETVEPSFETTAEVPTPAHKKPEEEYHHAVAPEAYKIHDEKEVTSPISSEGVQFKTEETTHIETVEPSFETTAEVPTPAHKEPEEEYHHAVAPEAYKIHDEKEVTSPISSEGEQFKTEETTHIETVEPSFETTAEVPTPAHKEPEEEYHHAVAPEAYKIDEKEVTSPISSEGVQFKTEETTHIETVEPSFETTAEVPTPAHKEPEEEYHHAVEPEAYKIHDEKEVTSPISSEGEQFKTEETTHIETVEPSFETTAEVPTPSHKEPEEEYHHIIESEEYEHHAEKDVASPVPSEGEQFKTEETTHIETVQPSFETTAEVPTSAHEEHEEEYHHVIESEKYEHHAEKDVASPVPSEGDQFKTEETTNIETVEPSFETTAEVSTTSHEEPEEEYHHVIKSEEHERHMEKDISSPVPQDEDEEQGEETSFGSKVASFAKKAGMVAGGAVVAPVALAAMGAHAAYEAVTKKSPEEEVSTFAMEETDKEYHHVVEPEAFKIHDEKEVTSPVPSEGEQFKTKETTHIETVEPSFETTAEVPTPAHEEPEEEYHHGIKSEEYEHHAEKDVASPVPSEGERFKTEETTHIETVEPSFETTAEVPTPARKEPEEEYHRVIESEDYEHHAEKDVASPVPSEGERFKTEETTHIETVEPSFETTAEVPTPARKEPEEEYHHVIESEEYEHHAEMDVASPVPSEGEQFKTEETTHIETVEPSFETTAEVPTPARKEPEEEYHHVIESEEYEHHAEMDVASPVPSEGEQFKTEETTHIETVEPSFETTAEVPTPARKEPEEENHHAVAPEAYKIHDEKEVTSPISSEGEQFKTEETTNIETVEPSFETTAEVPTPARKEPEEEYHHAVAPEAYKIHDEKEVTSPIPSEGEQFKTKETAQIETVEPSFETTAEVPTPAHEEPEEEYHRVIESEEYENHAEKDVASPVPSEGEQFKTEETTNIETVEPSFETTAEAPASAHEEPEEEYHHVIESEEYEHRAEMDVASPVPSEREQFKTEETSHIETVEPTFETTAEVPTPAHKEPEEEYHHVIKSEEHERHMEKDISSPVPQDEGEEQGEEKSFGSKVASFAKKAGMVAGGAVVAPVALAAMGAHAAYEAVTKKSPEEEVSTFAMEETDKEYHHVVEPEAFKIHDEKEVTSPVPSEGEQFKTKETTHIETVEPSFETTTEVITAAHEKPEEEYHHVIEPEEYEHHAERDVASPVPSEGEQFKTEETTHIETVQPSFETTTEVITAAHEEPEEAYHHVIESEEYEHHAEKDVASPVPSEGEQFKTEETTHIETVQPSFETTAEVPTPAHKEPEEEYHHVIESEEYEHHAEKDVASPVPSEGEQFKTKETTHIETVEPSFETTTEVITAAHEKPEEEYHHVIEPEEYEHHAERDVASPVPYEGEQFKTEETTHIETVEPSVETTAEVATPAHKEPEEEYHHVIESEEYEHHAEKDVASPVPSEGEQFKTEETTHIETVQPSFETTTEVITAAHEEPEEVYHHVIESEEYEHHAEKDVASPVPSEGEQFKTEETTHIETVQPSFETTAEVPTPAHKEPEEEYHHVIESEEYEHHAEKDVASPVPSEGEQFKTEETTHIETVQPSFETTTEVITAAHEEPEEAYHHVIESEEYEHHAEKDVASPVPSEGEQFKTEETTHIETVQPSFETTAEVPTPAHKEPEEEYHHVIESEEYEHHAEKDVASPVPSEGEQFKTEETTHIETVQPSFETTTEVITAAHEEPEEAYHHVIESEEYEHHAEKDVASPVPSEGEQFKTEETTHIETVEPSFETTAEVPTPAHMEPEEEYHHVIESEEYEHHAEMDVASPVPSEGEQFKTEETTHIETVEPTFETTAEVPTPAHKEPEEEHHHVIESEEYEQHAEKDVALPVPSEGEQKTEETTHIETVEPSIETTAEVSIKAHGEPEEEYHHVIESEEYEQHAEKDVALPVPSEGEQKIEETTHLETVEPSIETTAEVSITAHGEPEEEYHHVIESEEYEQHAEKDVALPVPSEGEQKTEETTNIETVEPSFETTAEVPTPAHKEPEEEYHHVIESEEYEQHAEKDVASPVPSEGEQFKTEETTNIETVEPSFETTAEVPTPARKEPEEEYHRVIESEDYEHHAEKDVASPVPSEGEQFKTEETTNIETVEPSFETTAEVPTPAHKEPEEEYHHVIESEEYEHHAEKDVALPVPSEGEQKTEETTHIETVEPSFETTSEVSTTAHEDPKEEYHHVINSEEHERHMDKGISAPVPQSEDDEQGEETSFGSKVASFAKKAGMVAGGAVVAPVAVAAMGAHAAYKAVTKESLEEEESTFAMEETNKEYGHAVEPEAYKSHAEKEVTSPVPSEGEQFKTEEATHIETIEPSFETTTEVITAAHEEPEEENHHVIESEEYEHHAEKDVASPVPSEGDQFKTEETTHIETIEPSFETTTEVITAAHEEPEEENHHVIESKEYEQHAEKDVASPVPSEGEQFKTEETTHIETIEPSFETTTEVITAAHEEPEEENHHVIESEEYEYHAEKDAASPIPSEGDQFKTEETTHIETIEPSFETTTEVITAAREEPEEEYHHVIESEEYEQHAEKDVESPVPSEREQFKTEDTTHIETIEPSFETTTEVITAAREEPEEEYHHVIESEEYEQHAEKDVESPVPSEGEQFKTEETTHIETVEPSFETTTEVITAAREEPEEEYHHVIESEEYEQHAEKDVESPVPSEGEQFKTEETTHIETVEPSFEKTAVMTADAHDEPGKEDHKVSERSSQSFLTTLSELVAEPIVSNAVEEAVIFESLSPTEPISNTLEQQALENVNKMRYNDTYQIGSPEKQPTEVSSSELDESNTIAGDDDWKVYDSHGEVLEEFSSQLTEDAISDAQSDFRRDGSSRRLIKQESTNEVTMEPEVDYQSDLQEKLDILEKQSKQSLPVLKEDDVLESIQESGREDEDQDSIEDTATQLVTDVMETVLELQDDNKTVTTNTESNMYYSATEQSKDDNYDTCVTSQEDAYDSAQGWTSQDSEYTTATSGANSRLSDTEERQDGTVTPLAVLSPVDSDRQFTVSLDYDQELPAIRHFGVDDTARSTPDVALQITIEEEEPEENFPTSPSGVLLGPSMDPGRPISPMPPRERQADDDDGIFVFVNQRDVDNTDSTGNADTSHHGRAMEADNEMAYSRQFSDLSSDSHAETVIHKTTDEQETSVAADELTSTYDPASGSTDSLDQASVKSGSSGKRYSTSRRSSSSSVIVNEPEEQKVPSPEELTKSPTAEDAQQESSPQDLSPQEETVEGFVVYTRHDQELTTTEGELETVEEEPEDSDSVNGSGNSSIGEAGSLALIGKYKHVSSDNVSLTSLQEFERLEQLLASRGDASLTASEIELYSAAKLRSGEGSVNSLAEFERLEQEIAGQSNLSPQEDMMLSVVKEESEAEEMSIRDDEEDDHFSETELHSRPIREDEEARVVTPTGSPTDSLEGHFMPEQVAAMFETSTDSLEPSVLQAAAASSQRKDSLEEESFEGFEVVPAMQDSLRDSLENLPQDKDSLLEGASQDMTSQDTRGLLSSDTVGTYQEHDDDDKDSLGGEMDSMLRSYPTTLTTFETTSVEPDGTIQTISRRVETKVRDPVVSHVTFTGTESAERLRDLPEEEQFETVDSEGNVTRTTFRRQSPHRQ